MVLQGEASISGQETHKAGAAAHLWVDKYRPRKFLDLLSDEQINREVLRWLKSWDRIVFDIDPAQSSRRPQRDKGTRTGPEYRILLISGPPGERSPVCTDSHLQIINQPAENTLRGAIDGSGAEIFCKT